MFNAEKFKGNHDADTPYAAGDVVSNRGKLFIASKDAWGPFSMSEWSAVPSSVEEKPKTNGLGVLADLLTVLRGEQGEKGDKGDDADMEAVNEASKVAAAALSSSREVQRAQSRVIIASEKALTEASGAKDIAARSEKIAKESDKKAQKSIDISISAKEESAQAIKIALSVPAGSNGKDGNDGKDGKDGVDGKSISYKGAYVEGQYAEGEIVKYNGELLIATDLVKKAPRDAKGRLRKGWDVVVEKTRQFGSAAHASILFRNSGAGAGILQEMRGGVQYAKSLVAGTNVSLDEDADTITISASGGGGGTVESASNIGTGTGIFAQLTGTDLEFKSLTTPDGKLTITDNADEVDLQVNAVGLTGDESISGIKTFSSFPILPGGSPSGNQAASAGWVEGIISTGISWKEPVLNVNQNTPPGAPTAGDRYTLGNAPTGVWSGQADAIAEYNGATWDFSASVAGDAALNLSDNLGYNYNGTTWVLFNAPTIYTASLGVQLVGNDFRANLDAARAITLSGNAIGVNTGAGLTITSNAVTVAALGVTNAMLAGSIADTKLSTISTANKVNWNALIASGGKITNSNVNDLADVNAGSPTNGQALTWDTASSRWIASTITIPSAIGTGEVISNVPFLVGAGANVVWTNMPAAVTELLGSAFNRIRYDLTAATQYRIIVNQAVAGFAGSDINLQYSTDNTTYFAADTAAAGELDVGTGTGVKTGAWTNLVAGAKSNAFLRIVGKQGDGVADPAFRQINVQFRVPVGTGDFVGPSSSTDGNLVAYSGATGKLGKASSIGMSNANGDLNHRGLTAGQPTFQAMFSADGDGTDTVGRVIYGVGAPGVASPVEALFTGYIAGDSFYILSDSNNADSLPITLSTKGNSDQLKINADGTIDFDNFQWENVFIDDSPDVHILKVTNKTAGTDGYFGLSGSTADGTEAIGIALITNGTTPVGTDIQAAIWTYDPSGSVSLLSYASGTEQANPMTIGVIDADGGANNITMLRNGKTGWGLSDPADLELSGQIGVDVRPMVTKYAAQASDIGAGLLGATERYEGYEDETGNISLYTIASGTRSSPTATADDLSARDEIVLAWDGANYIFCASSSYRTTSAASSGTVPMRYDISLMDNAGDLVNCLVVEPHRLRLPDYDAAEPLAGGYVGFEEDAYGARGTLRFNDGGEDVLVVATPANDLPANGQSPVFDSSTEEWVPRNVAQIAYTTSIANQSASIGGTPFTDMPSAESLIRISYNLVVTTADLTAGAVSVDFGWDDGVTGRATLNASILMTATNFQSGSLVIRKGASTTVQYSTIVSGTPGTARYALLITAEPLT